MNLESLIVKLGSQIKLKDYDPKYTGDLKNKTLAKELLGLGIKKLQKYQDMLYAQNTYALLIILQAMDAAGKDSTIKHVMSGINPQGCQVYSFKAPSKEELEHDYLWRSIKALPKRGCIGIHNRSYYEEVLVPRVHPEFLAQQQLPPKAKGKEIWEQRFEEINYFEKYLTNNGIIVLKFFLNVSKEEQKKRILKRINLPEKNWKFSLDDLERRVFWEDYMQAYEDIFNHTSTQWAPWFIIPADRKWFTRLSVATIICDTLEKLDLHYPTINEQKRQELLKAKAILESES
jgi:PPK2 family polyphosphate:nucleotide phosphotransferase